MDLLESLHQRLLLSISSAGISADQPITIGDLYQRLVPYRAVRGELSILELAEYEHALLRLLSGEGGFAEIESSAVRAEIQRELASTNPILGIYMDYPEAPLTLRRQTGVPGGSAAAQTGLAGADAAAGDAEWSAQRSDASVPAVGGTPARKASGNFLPENADLLRLDTEKSQHRDSLSGVASAGNVTVRSLSELPESDKLEPLPLIYPEEIGSTGSSGRESVSEGGADAPESAHRHHPYGRLGGGIVPTADILQCGGCSAPLPSTIDCRYCPFCGEQQAPCVCGRCGSRCAPEWRFCPGCGSSLR